MFSPLAQTLNSQSSFPVRKGAEHISGVLVNAYQREGTCLKNYLTELY